MANEKDKVIVADVVDETKKTTESEAPKQEAEVTEEKVGLLKKAKEKISDWWHRPGPSPEDRFKKAAKVGAVVGLGVAAYAVGKKVQEAKEFAALEGSAETPALPGDTEVVEDVNEYVDEPYVEEEYVE